MVEKWRFYLEDECVEKKTKSREEQSEERECLEVSDSWVRPRFPINRHRRQSLRVPKSPGSLLGEVRKVRTFARREKGEDQCQQWWLPRWLCRKIVRSIAMDFEGHWSYQVNDVDWRVWLVDRFKNKGSTTPKSRCIKFSNPKHCWQTLGNSTNFLKF